MGVVIQRNRTINRQGISKLNPQKPGKLISLQNPGKSDTGQGFEQKIRNPDLGRQRGMEWTPLAAETKRAVSRE